VTVGVASSPRGWGVVESAWNQLGHGPVWMSQGAVVTSPPCWYGSSRIPRCTVPPRP